MKSKKILLVCLLLAILTMGVVSAEGDSDFNETLTTGIDDEVSIDASYDDEITSEDSGDLIASSENDVLKDDGPVSVDVIVDEEFSLDSVDDIAWIHLPVGADEGFASVHDEFGNNLFDSEVGSDSHWFADETDGHYICSIAPKDLDWSDVGEILTFSFSNDDVKVLGVYEFVKHFDGSAKLEPLFNRGDFDWWISEHEFHENDWSRLCDVWYNDNVNDGTITLKIEYDTDTWTDEKRIGDYIYWNLEDIDFIEECGDYKVSLIYSNDDLNVTLCKDRIFTLTELNYGTAGYVYIAYPFDVIRFYSEEDDECESTYIDVYVDGAIKLPSEENPFRWTLEDLGIDEGGEYPITIIAFRGDEAGYIEEFKYTLIVDENLYDVRLYSNELGVERWNMEEPVLYVVYPEGLDEHYAMKIYEDDELLFEFDVNSSRNWTLDELGIDRNGGFNVRLYAENEYGDEEQIADAWLNVNGIISQDNFNYWISTHECKNEDESFVSEVWINDVDEGILILSIENSAGDIQTYERSVEGTDNVHWELRDLDIIDETGTYTVNLTYSNNGRNISLEENHIFQLTKLYYNVCEDVYVANPFDVIRFYSDEDEDGEALYDVKVYVDGEEREFGGENPYRWTLKDLEIDDAGEYPIAIEVYSGNQLVEEFTYTLNVDDDLEFIRLFTSDLGVEIWDADGPVLYLAYPEGMYEHFIVKIRDDEEDEDIGEFDVDSSRSWTLDELGIGHDGNYNIQLLDDDGEFVTDIWLNVRCIDDYNIKTWIWDTEEDGDLYNDTESKIISVEIPEDKHGEIVITVNGENVANWEIDERYQEWTLDDLGMTEVGEYDVIVEYIGDESEEILANITLNVVEFDYNDFRAIINTNKRQIEVYCPEDCEGEIKIRIIDGDVEDEVNFNINDSYKGVWTTFSFTDLNVLLTNDYEIILEMDEYRCEKEVNRWVEVSIWNGEDERGPLYDDSQGNVIYVYIPDSGKSATLHVLLDDELKFITKLSRDRDVSWDLKQLNITESADLELKFVFEGDVSESIFYHLDINSFENDTNRAKIDIENSMIDVFALSGSQTLTINGYDDWGDPVFYYEYDFHTGDYNTWKEIPLSGFGLEEGDWCLVEVIIDDDYFFSQGFRIPWEDEDSSDNPEVHSMDDDSVLEHDDDAVFSVSVPADFVLKNASINVTSGDYEFFKNLTEIMPVWNNGRYNYEVTFGDLDRFETLEDKAIIKVTLKYDDFANNESYVAINSLEFILKKTDSIVIFEKSVMDDDWICIDTDEMHDDELVYDVNSDGDRLFAYVMIPDITYPGVSDGKIIIYSGEEVIFERYLSDYYDSLDPEEYMGYDYPSLGVIYKVFFRELDLSKAKDKDLVSIQFVAQNYEGEDRAIVYHIADDDTVIFYDAGSSISLDDDGNLGNVDDIEYIAQITISDDLNDEGYLSIVCGDRVLFNRTLNEIKQDETYDKIYSYSNRGYIYYIPKGDMLDDLKDGDVLKFTLYYDGEVEDYYEEKVIENGTEKYIKATISPADVFDKFGINITDQKLVNLENGTLNLITFEDTNRQTIDRKLRNGYFCVYVNGVKVENLGKLLYVEPGQAPITELELFWLCAHENKNFTLTVENLGITENGEYDILVTYVPEISDPGDLEYNDYREINVTSLNVELTSNVKANYENESVEWLTGYGVDPILMYLDTYYGDINATTGKITVLNSDNDPILVKNIKNLTYEGGRYLLKYSDFTNKNFGDKIAVKYSDGNERNGETSLDVLWRDIEPTDFNTTVIDDLDDYYGNFVNMNIPAVITAGQVIVTVKFKNNHNSSISNMNVTTDFDSHAAYTFNVADIHANYENGNFALSLSDLGFYEIDGDYEIDVKFTADGQNILNVSDNTFNVALSSDVIITINETSRYGLAQAFATIKIFEPMPAYGELYIDGVLYSHQTFEKGLITFVSSPNWASGIHTAEVKVFNSEFEQLLNSSAKEFEVLTKTDDVEVVVPEFINENAMVDLQFIAPVNGTVLIRIDDGDARYINVSEGVNLIQLGVLGYGNHTIWMLYNETLADGSIAFYNNYLNIFAGDDGHWMNLPDPLVLNDDDTIKFNFGEGVEGNITISIDNGLIEKLIPLVNGSAEFKLDESLFDESNKYGKHTYNITYSGDAVHEELSRNGTFTVSYLFRDNLVKEGVPLSIYYLIIITLPSDANGIVYITLEGKTYNSTVSNGQAEFRIDQSLDMGEHDVVIKYDGDAKYPQSEYATVLNISYYGVFGEFNEGNRFVSLVLPANATGNLTVYNDNRGTRLYSKALVDGKAVIDLNELPVGIYELRAVYEGDDYDARPCNAYFKVMPYVYITQNATIEDDVTIFVDLDDSTGHILILRDGLSPVLEEIVNGVINYTFSTVGYVYGDHNVTFQYIGKSFDSDLFNELDPTTGRYVPINYNLHLLSQEVDLNKTLEGNKLIVDFSPDAHGTAILLVNGVEHQVENIVNGQAVFDISDIHGDVVLTVIYSGDGKYAPYIDEFYMSIKAPRIAASDLSVLYTANKVYSVTVYGSDGKVVKGVSVSFLINNKAYKTVKTNAKGVASVSITQAPGSYKVTVKALKVSTTKKITVKHILTLKKVKVKRSAKKLVIKATLKKVNGKYLKGKKITLKFNGKKIKAKTNKKGVAKFTVKSNVLKKLKVGKKVKYQATYLKDTVKKSVKVKK